MPATDDGSGGFLERRRESDFGRLQSWRKAKDDPREHRDRQRKAENASIGRRGKRQRSIAGGHQPQEQPVAPNRDRQSCCAAQHGKQQAFNHQL